MKVYIFMTLLVTVSAAPAPRAIDWDKIEEQIQVLQNGMYTSGIEYIKSIAIADNVEIGTIISTKLDEAAVTGKNLLDNAYAPIQERNVTGHNMRELLATYGLFIDQAQSYIWDDVEQLSKEAYTKISDYFYVQDLFELYNYIQIPLYLEEIPLNPVDWEAAREQFVYLTAATTSAAELLKEVIVYGNPNVTDELFPVVDAGVNAAHEKIDEAIASIGDEELRLREAIEIITRLHGLMGEVRGVLDLYEWPNDVHLSFIVLFGESFQRSHLTGLQIYDALTGVDYFRIVKESKRYNPSIYNKQKANIKS